MTVLADTVLDAALNVLTTNLDRLDICSAEPSNYTEATSTLSLGNAATTTGSPANGATDGRRVTVAAVTGGAGSVTGTGTATHIAGTDGSSNFYLARALSASQAVTSGNSWNSSAFDVTIRDPA